MRRILLAVLPFLPLPALADTVTDFTLENGLQVLVIEDHRAPAVTQMVWYRTGAADEAPGHSGIAHFFEHLMFKATDDLKAGEFSDIVEAQGGSIELHNRPAGGLLATLALPVASPVEAG